MLAHRSGEAGHLSAGRSTLRGALEVGLVFGRLGLTSFGGPVAHLGYFRQEFVERRRWIDDAAYADLLALCQVLPGPASSQLGMAIGYLRAGFVGSVAAWLGFTLPSALLMFAFAMSLARAGQFSAAPWLHGLKLVAVAVVIQAIVNMGRSLCPDWSRRIAALLAGILAIRVTGLHGQLLVMLAGALFGWVMFRQRATSTSAGTLPDLSLTSSRILLAIFAFFLVALPPLAATLSWPWLTAFSGFYQTGALVFGGGHVVLPLLQSQLVASGQLTSDVFLAGYGVAQALPGPLFSIAAFAGALSTAQTLPWAGAVLATVGIFLPGYLLVLGGLPWWSRMCRSSVLAAVMAGVKAAVVGLLLASLQQTLLAGAVHTRLDLAWIALAWLAMQKGRVPPWVVVALAVAPGMWR